MCSKPAIAAITAIFLFSACTSNNNTGGDSDWQVYGGSKKSDRYSSLKQIDTGNVGQLQVDWTYQTRDADLVNSSQIQCNPIIVNGTLYGTTPKLRLIALNAATGRQKWVFNPEAGNLNNGLVKFILNNNRGVTYWANGADQRIFYCAGSNLYAVDALTGNRISTFGDNGRIDLHDGLGRDAKDLYVTATSPGIIYKDLLILGSRVNETADAAPGHIRAYDVHTGKIRWIFHTIPHPGEPGYDTWPDKEAWKHIGSANCWTGFSLDEGRGLLFAPTGSAAYDFYGGKRKGTDLYANCLLALDAATGKLKWYYQVIHHDMWDKDLPTAPSLVTVKKDGKAIDAVAQPTKHGFIFVLDRVTGKPLFPVVEQKVQTTTDLTGEEPWPTQPIPTLPEPFTRQSFTEKDINPYVSAASKADILRRLRSYRYGNMFLPPGKIPSVIFPGFDGGAEWGGPAYDPSSGWMFINANEMPWVMTMVDAPKAGAVNENYSQAGERLFIQNCMGCHGKDRNGTGNYPSLINIGKKYNDNQLTGLLETGRRMMPSFKQFSTEQRAAIVAYITGNTVTGTKKMLEKSQKEDPYLDIPYQMTGYNKFLSEEGYNAISPPWGTLNAVNLNTGKIEWKIPLGEDASLTNKGIPLTGTENYGGPVVTAGGLVFIAATKDAKIRAFNKRTGKLLWQAQLPAAGFATPSVYRVNGKEFVVIACGGGKLKTKSGDSYVAFALPGN
jgi:quinoprotein glucose dehydrogenase